VVQAKTFFFFFFFSTLAFRGGRATSREMGVAYANWGGFNHPQRPWGWFGHPQNWPWWWLNHPMWPKGAAKPPLQFLFLFFVKKKSLK
jgi:hypothetical protein